MAYAPAVRRAHPADDRFECMAERYRLGWSTVDDALPCLRKRPAPCQVKALTLDLLGTLIDWESGILAAFGPWPKRTGITADDNRLWTMFAEAESRIQAEQPTILYAIRSPSACSASAKNWRDAQPISEETRAFGQSVEDHFRQRAALAC